VLKKMGGMVEEPAPPADVVVTEDLQTDLPKAPAPKLRPDLEESLGVTKTQATAGTPEPALDEETQKFITQSLTDVDLFASYGLTQKAIGLLEAILRRAPTHTPTLEKLLDFVLGAGDDRRTAELAAQLEHIHAQRGDARSGERFAELRRRFQRAAGLSDEEIASAVAAAMPQPVETVPVAEEAAIEEAVVASPEFEIKAEELPEIEVIETPVEPPAAEIEAVAPEEVDLSSEWASLLDETKEPEGAPTAAGSPESTVSTSQPEAEEISLADLVPEKETPTAIPLEEIPHEELVPPSEDTGHAEFHVPVEEVDPESWGTPAEEIATEPVAQAPEVESAAAPAAEIAEHVPEALLPDEELTTLPVPEHAEIAAEGHEPALEVPEVALPATPAEPEFELDNEFELVLEPEELAAPHEMLSQAAPANEPQPAESQTPKEPVRVPSNGQVFSSDQFLTDLAKEIDDLGLDELTPAMSQDAAASVEQSGATEAKPNTAGALTESGPLKEVFDEFRAELGEMGAEDEDLETHYNLGVAFREMGLLEEAIGEFQKVAKANDRGKVFRYAMQCSTLLGLAFMEKGQPNIAAIWYERALTTPGIDSESKLALRYDLGVAQESAGELEAALKSFSQVYAVNIDYRDVAERIASLQKPAR